MPEGPMPGASPGGPSAVQLLMASSTHRDRNLKQYSTIIKNSTQSDLSWHKQQALLAFCLLSLNNLLLNYDYSLYAIA